MRYILLAPAGRLVLTLTIAVAVMGLVLFTALSQPWLGLTLGWEDQRKSVVIVAAQGPAASLAPGTAVVGISDNAVQHRLQREDLVLEPDGNLETYDDYRRYLASLDTLARLQRADTLYIESDNKRYALQPLDHRPISTLPAAFWVQVAVGVFAWLITGAVWAFRPRDTAVRYLLLSGFATLMFAPGAAVYTTRELGMPLDEMLILKTMNFGGGLLYCGTLVALLLHYPRRLAPGWVSSLVVLAFIGWFIAQAIGLFDSMMAGRRWPVFAGMLATIALGVVHWAGTRRDPVARASLQWFLLAWVLCTTLFVLLIMVPQIYGVTTDTIQGYAFLLFILVYAGLAFGILRYRLFDLGDWWFRCLTWLGGALLLIVLDVIFAFGLSMSNAVSLTLALLVCALVWLPLRSWLWHRITQRYEAPEKNLFRDIVGIALSSTSEDRVRRWHALLGNVFGAGYCEEHGQDIHGIMLANNGLSLLLPSISDIPASRITYADHGRRLFNRRDKLLAQQMIDMLRYADDSRDAYQRGAVRERERIRRDLHDDIGARLLTLLHSCTEEHHGIIRDALEDTRALVRALESSATDSEAAFSQWQSEVRQRCEAADVKLVWQQFAKGPSVPLSAREHNNLTRILRESVSNSLRHGTPDTVAITAETSASGIHIVISDDGHCSEPDTWEKGRGYMIMNERAREIGAEISWRVNDGCTVSVCLDPVSGRDDPALTQSP